MHLVVGLGNPGRRYAGTRHNVGFLVVERLAQRWEIDPDAKRQFGAVLGDGRIGQSRVLLCRPQQYMNRSGLPARSVAGYHNLESQQVVAIHDDMDLPFGTVRCKAGGGHGGHNGLRDLTTHLGREFLRVRCGVGRPPEGWEPSNYVLGKWSEAERSALPEMVDRAADATEVVLSEGITEAMNRFNTRRRADAGTVEDANPTEAKGSRFEEL